MTWESGQATEQELSAASAGNTSFDPGVPGLQLAMDSTSLGAYKQCPRKYYYGNIFGLQSSAGSIHLDFGVLIHKMRQWYEQARVDGAGHEEGLRQTVQRLLARTWADGRPTGLSNPTPEKNRVTLIRTTVWYLDQVAQHDHARTVQLDSGAPAVELAFALDFEHQGTPWVLCGHLDRLAEFNGELFVADIKTTKSTLSPHWYNEFAPHNQFYLYAVAGKVAFRQEVQGVILDGIQIGATFSRFGRSIVKVDAYQSDEWLAATRWWLDKIRESAETRHWPMNETGCNQYGGCQFRGLCAMSPGTRRQWGSMGFTKRMWDPLSRRDGGE